MRKEDKQALGPDMHRPIDKQEIQEPNEGDPERRELGHLVGQTAEAQEGVFETGAPSSVSAEGVPVEHSSSPDLTNPATAKFTRVDDTPEMRSSRDDLPPPDRHLAPEMAGRRSDDDLRTVARPGKGATDNEVPELHHSPQAMKEPKEPMDH